MFDTLYFEYPKAFSFIVIYIACEAYCKIRAQAIYFPHVKQLSKETTQLSSLMWFLKWFGILFLLLALMSPVRDESLVLEPEHGPDIVFILQANATMNQSGLDPLNKTKTWYTVGKKWISSFIEKHPYSSYAIVVATDESYIASPLSSATKAVQNVVEQLVPSHFNGVVDYASATQQALRVLEYAHAKRKVLIYIGNNDSNTTGSFENVRNMKRYNIFLVSEERLERDEKREQLFEVSTLVRLDNVEQIIDENEKLTTEKYDYNYKTYYYFYPLFLAFFSFLIYVYLRNRRGNR